jgi:hypothetical protein
MIPARSLPENVLSDYADQTIKNIYPVLGMERTAALRPLEAWSLPFLMDGLLGRFPLGYIEGRAELPGYMWRELAPWVESRGPTSFAQELVFSPVVPFEASPLSGKSVAEVITAAGGSAGGAVGFYATGDPLLLIVVPAGIILCGAATAFAKVIHRAAEGVGDALYIGARARVLRWLGVPDPDEDPPPPTPPTG